MTRHVLKTWPVPFGAILSGAKTAEFRPDDRGYRDGDVLELVKWDNAKKAWVAPRHAITVKVTHVQHGFGIPDGYAMLSFRVLGVQRGDLFAQTTEENHGR